MSYPRKDTMTDGPTRRAQFVTFPDSPRDEHTVMAVVVTYSPETGEYHGFGKAGPGFPDPDPELVQMIAQAAALQSLTTTQEGHTDGR
jgi:hypothetical protein